MNFRKTQFLVMLLPVMMIAVNSATAQDWPELRGSDGTGSVSASGILTRAQKIGLKMRWKKKLGSGYSSVVVSGDRVVTMYSGEADDMLGCFATQDGEKIWSVPIGTRFKGENGSFDGPISTPLIRNGNVYGLSPNGKLFCVSLADGAEIWTRDLVIENAAQKPLYGFATTPILAAGNLIVQTGGEEKSLTALDAESGETQWATSNDSINSQTPVLIKIEGREMVLAAGGKKLTGIDPNDGTVLFEHAHGGGNGSAMVPVVFDGNKVLMTLDDGFSTAVSIRKIDDIYQVSQEWKQRSIKNTYNVPVIHDGHFYAYSTRILTCVDAATGTPSWKSREPGDGFLIVVDGHVILNTKRGALHVLRATVDQFENVAGMEVFDDLVWSLPAYSEGAVFMRSLGELACVDITSDGEIAKSEGGSAVGPQFSEMLAKVAASDQPQKIVDAYLAPQRSFPLVEGKLAHFVYQGDATDVAVAGDMFGARQERKMQQIPRTNTWYQVTELPADVRVNYVFLVDYKPKVDPRNDQTMTSTMYAGEMEFAVRLRKEAPLEMSWFGMSNWNEPAFTKPVEKVKGEFIKKTVPTKLLDKPYEIQVYLPSKQDADQQRRPVVYVYDGAMAQSRGRLHELVDNLEAESGDQPAPILVFMDGPPAPDFLDSVATEIVPLVDEEFNTIADRTARICMSNGMSAPVSLQLVAKHPDVFGGASVQTPLIFDADQQRSIDEIAKIELPTQIYLEWGKYDMFNPDENWDARKIGKRMFDEFAKSSHVKVFGGEVPDSTDWSSWRNRFDRILSMFEPGSHADSN